MALATKKTALAVVAVAAVAVGAWLLLRRGRREGAMLNDTDGLRFRSDARFERTSDLAEQVARVLAQARRTYTCATNNSTDTQFRPVQRVELPLGRVNPTATEFCTAPQCERGCILFPADGPNPSRTRWNCQRDGETVGTLNTTLDETVQASRMCNRRKLGCLSVSGNVLVPRCVASRAM